MNVALEVLKELDLSIPVCGMVKDDRHRTRGLYYNNEEIPIDKHSEGFKLITRLQDEAHRFAITYHKSLRGKAQVKSFLDDIPGIGPARRKALRDTESKWTRDSWRSRRWIGVLRRASMHFYTQRPSFS